MRNLIVVLLLLVSFFLLLTSCADKYPVPAEKFSLEKNSCTSCHLNANLLKEVAEPIDVTGGESGET